LIYFSRWLISIPGSGESATPWCRRSKFAAHLVRRCALWVVGLFPLIEVNRPLLLQCGKFGL
jgi:hypothetical protein